MEVELRSDFIQTFFDQQLQSSQLEESIIDYVLRCTRGIYKGYYIYLNVTNIGETIGSGEKDVTLVIDDAGIAERHATIKLEFDEELGRYCYSLRDLRSGLPTWIKIRYDIPVVVRSNMEIKIGKKLYTLRFTDPIVNEAVEWLHSIEMGYLEKMFQDNHIVTLNDVKSLMNDQIDKLFACYNYSSEQFLQSWAQLSTDFPQWYINRRLEILEQDENKTVFLNVGWVGATISSKTYVYQKPPDKYLNKQEFDDYEENPAFELTIRYMYGKYILQTWKMDNYNIFFRVSAEEPHTLVPDDTIRLGNIELTVQRFNTGVYVDQGSRYTMEDGYAMVQDLGISSKVPVSCFGVFDGHNGDECVKYVSQNLLDNMREFILKGTLFDQQQNFYSYMADLIKETFVSTDDEFYQEFKDDKAIFSGCVAILCIIAGDIIITANVGDCRAILSRGGQAISLSVDHKPEMVTEKTRIEKKGGSVTGSRLGQIAVSRAFGDFGMKKQKHISKKNLLSVKPDIRCIQLDYKKDEFIVLCSDGVIEGFQSNQNIVNFVREKYSESKITEQDAQQAAKGVVQQAYNLAMSRRKQSDNLSAIVINVTRGLPQCLERTIIK